MSCVYSSRFPRPIPCTAPLLTINVPVAPVPGNTVVLANGAVIDLVRLGEIIAENCPLFVCEPGVIVQSTETIQAAPFGTGRTVDLQ